MALIDLKRIQRVVKLDKTVFKEIRDDKDALGQGLVLVVLVGLITAVFQALASVLKELIEPTFMGMGSAVLFSLILIVATPLAGIICIFLFAILPHLIAKHGFKGKSSYIGYVKAFCFVEVVSLLTIVSSLIGIIPFVGGILAFLLSLVFSIVYMAYWVIATREAHEISTVGAVVSVVLPIVIYMVIAIVLVVIAAIILGAAFASLISQGAMYTG